MAREISKEEFSARITWLLWGRAILTTFVVGTLFFFHRRYHFYSFRPVILLYAILSVYLLTAVYLVLLKRLHSTLFFSYVQSSIDILLITLFVYLTDGIDSGLSLLYHLAIIAASISLSRRGGYLAASLASILYGAMLDLQYYGMLGMVRSSNFTPSQVFYHLFINLLSFYTVALLSGNLSERLRATRQALRAKSLDLEDLRALQEHILRSVGSGILTMDLEGTVTSWNPAAEQITGYTYGEIRQIVQEVFGESLKGIFGHTDMLLNRPYRFDGTIITRNGGTAILGMIASLLKDEKNAIRGIILTFQDITKFVEMEEQVRRQERLATVGSLAAGIAHEIRNPLASLSGSIQLLRGELELHEDDRRLMDIVVKETDRLNTIITDFLDYARHPSAPADAVELLVLLGETIMLLRNSNIYRPEVTIFTDITPSLKVRADAKRLKQVFWNLLINACHAMPGEGRITIAAFPEDNDEENDERLCKIIVEDTGSGISKDNLKKIFDPFFTTKKEGTGLGLAIAYRIIEDHSGTITVQSDPGKGSRFIIKLPLAGESEKSQTADEALPDGTEGNAV